MYFCKYDMGEMASMIYNWESDQVSPDTHTCNKQHMFADVGLLYQRFLQQPVSEDLCNFTNIETCLNTRVSLPWPLIDSILG